MAAKSNKRPRPVIVVRRQEVVEAGHGGGAWKVAYADFVTAMMAFFLLMWLLNATTEAQRTGLADYFTASNALSRNSSGSGQPFGGHTPFDNGAMVSDRGMEAVIPGKATQAADGSAVLVASPSADRDTTEPGGGEADAAGAKASSGGQAAVASLAPVKSDYLAQAASGSAEKADAAALDPDHQTTAALRAELAQREAATFQQAAQAIRDAVAADPGLAELARQLTIDMTPEGLRIQLLDAERQPMFDTGSAAITDRAQSLLRKVAPVVAKLSQDITVSGHTDAAPYKGGDKTNWELSSERANATRRLLAESGLAERRFRSVTGNADRDPLLPADPFAAANRRIAIVVLRSALPHSGGTAH